jgi:hypothetical protein
LFGCAELTLLFYPFKLKSQNDVGQGGIGDSRIEKKRAGEEETERKRTGKGLTGDIQRKKQKNYERARQDRS